MSGPLRSKYARRKSIAAAQIPTGINHNILETGKRGRIQIVTEVKSQWADRRLVAHPQSDGVR